MIVMIALPLLRRGGESDIVAVVDVVVTEVTDSARGRKRRELVRLAISQDCSLFIFLNLSEY